MIAKLSNRARQIVQGNAHISRQLIRSVAGEVQLQPSASALNLHPHAAILAGDNGRSVHENSEILHKAAPLKVEKSLYPVGATKRVLKVKDIRLQLSGRNAAKLAATQLLAERNSSVRRKAELLNVAPAIEADADNLAITGNDGRSAHELTGHTSKLLWPFDLNTIAHGNNVRDRISRAQPKVRILVFSRDEAFELAGFQLHLISHPHKLCRVHPKAGSALDALVSFRAAFPRRHLNHSHKSASYSYAHHAELVAGVTPEANRNTGRTS